MRKLLMVTPHLSTGGLPQYLLKQIEHFISEYEIFVIEWSDITGGLYVVQKNKISELISERLITLSDNKDKILELIGFIKPNIIHFQEIPESFIDVQILKNIYREDRDYSIVVTTHSSTVDVKGIKYGADKFVLVSKWSKSVFVNEFGEDICDIWEYPIENIEYDKYEYKKLLGFDDGYHHILNVGLFTPGKNQKELIELARTFKDEKVKFHFVGNQADNFSNYWKPLMSNLPNNCIVHGERSDVDLFYKACDLFYFTSNFELNPLVVREALSHKLPTFIKKLDTYQCSYDGLVKYISNDPYDNKKMILEELENQEDSIAIVLAHCDTEYRKDLLRKCIESLDCKIILSCNYPVSEDIQEMCDYVLFTKDNPLLLKGDYSKYNISYNYWYINESGEKIEIPFEYEHSYAVYCLIRNGLNMVKNMNVEKIHIINYDYQIDSTVINLKNKLLGKNDLSFFLDNESSYCSGFFSGRKKCLLNFFNIYANKDDFYKNIYTVLEKRIYKFYNESSEYKIDENPLDELKKNSKVNQEGVLQFSKK